jgi:hypothetical protein
MPLDLSKAAAEQNPAKAIEKQEGVYNEAGASVPEMQKLPQSSLPQASDPSPFTIGPVGGQK